MAINNHERVGKAMDLVKAGVDPFVEREFKNVFQEKALSAVLIQLCDGRLNAKQRMANAD